MKVDKARTTLLVALALTLYTGTLAAQSTTQLPARHAAALQRRLQQNIGNDGSTNELVVWGASIPGVPSVLPGPYIAAAAGEEHVLVLSSDGTITAHGQNTRGQMAIPLAARAGVKAIAAGAFHSLALLNDGTVVGWGSQAAAAVPTGLTGVVAIAAGREQSIALLQDGSVRAWGINECVDLSTVTAPGFVTAVAAGDQHLLFLMTDGTVTGAGCNGHGRAEWPAYLPKTNAIAIAAGFEHSMALLGTGEVVVWGGGKDGQKAVPEAAKTGVIQIASSNDHCLALREDGTVLTWGQSDGVLDVVPNSVASRQAISIAAGTQLSLAILKPIFDLSPPSVSLSAPPTVAMNPTQSAAGQSPPSISNAPPPPTGTVDTTNGTAMQPPPSVSGAPAPPLAAPSSLNPPSSPPLPQSLPRAPTSGSPPADLLAISTTFTTTNTAQPTPAVSTFRKLLQTANPNPTPAPPPMFSLVKNTTPPPSQTLESGNQPTGPPPSMITPALDQPPAPPPPTFQLPTFSPPAPQPTPSPPPPPPGISGIVIEPPTSSQPPPPPSNSTSQTGGAVLLAATLKPGDTPFPNLGRDVMNISAGYQHAVALFHNGTVVAWGNNDLNQTVVPPGLTNVAEISAGWDQTLARLSDGTIIGWDKCQKDAVIPPEIPQQDVKHVAAGGGMSWVVFNNGSIYGWGSSFCGQLNYPPFDNVEKISSGQDHTVALLNNGTVAAWGCNQQDQLALPPEVLGATGQKVVKVVAGSFHNLALLDNGTVVTWGYNLYGLSDVPETAKRDVVDIAAGDAHSLVLRSDGSVIGWGRDDSGQVSTLMQQAGTDKVVAIAAGGNQSYALTGNCCFKPLDSSLKSSPSQSIDDDNDQGLHGGILAAVILPPILLLLALALLVLLWRRQTSKWSPSEQLILTSNSSFKTTSMNRAAAASGMSHNDTLDTRTSNRYSPAGLVHTVSVVPSVGVNIPNLPAEDPFLGAAAAAYIWTSTNSDQVVEAGITDDQLDVMTNISRPAAAAGSSSVVGGFHPVIQLSAQDLRQQIRMISNGLISADSTFLTFKCMWPTRFGSGLLAAKVMKDVTDLDPAAIQSFADEARLLSNVSHPHVIKLYGYCVEAPTMCLIMELLPRNLHDVLYSTPGRTSNDHDVAGAHAVITINDDATEQTKDGIESVKLLGGSVVSKTFSQAGGSVVRNNSQQAAVSNHLPMPQILQLGCDIAAGLVGLQGQARAPLPRRTDDGSVTATVPTIKPKDIKPTGIWLNSQGVAKVCSVGVLQHMPANMSSPLCMDAGTIPYMPPEDLGERQDHHHLTSNQDDAEEFGSALAAKLGVYSLGMIMWEMLAGRAPWGGMNELTMLHAITTGQRPRIPSGLITTRSTQHKTISEPGPQHEEQGDIPSRTDAPQAIYELINECWHQEIMNRPSAAEVFARLQCLSEAIELEPSSLKMSLSQSVVSAPI